MLLQFILKKKLNKEMMSKCVQIPEKEV